MNKEFDIEEKFELAFFDKGLRRLNELMEEKKLEPLTLYVIGGFCMLAYGLKI